MTTQLNGKEPLSIVFAIPDHPWYLSGDMSAVRIAMTVGTADKQEGELLRVVDPRRNAAQGGDDLRPAVRGLILPNLSIGTDTDETPMDLPKSICECSIPTYFNICTIACAHSGSKIETDSVRKNGGSSAGPMKI